VTRTGNAFHQLRAVVFRLVKPHRRDFYAGLFATAASNGLAVLIPLVFRTAIDDIVQHGSTAPLLLYGLAVIALTGGKGFGDYLAHRCIAGMGQRVAFDLRNELFAHLQTLPPAYLDRANTGDLMSRGTSDVEGIRLFITWSLSTILEMICLFSAALVLMLALSWQLTLVACALFPALAVTVTKFRRRLRPRYLAVQEQYGHMATALQENLAGIRLIQAYQREESEVTRFQALNEELFQRNLAAARERAMYLPLLFALGSAAGGAILWFGGSQVIAGSLSLGEFVAFIGYVALLAKPLTMLGWVISLAQRAVASLGRVEEVLAVPSMPDPTIMPEWPTATSRPSSPEQPIVVFEGVHFAYNGHPVLHGIDLQGRRGEFVAITGPSGAGKSTMAHLIPRLYDVSAGRILLHGVDVRELPLPLLRHYVAMVPQETFLFSVSVAENLAYGRPDAPPEMIQHVAQQACLWESIHALPHGLDTLVGERGITLSGGQKQRVALARALLYGGDVLVLDDPFSNVDAETEMKLLETIRLAARDRFVLLITHRIRTLQAADRIMVMADGRIVAQGPHQALLAAGGLYRDLYERQSLQESLA
jgi:ABC-type multidrug transport system fused ATPase/permease subunit